ncbi:MAG: MATE family efflux transporter [Ruminococcaceae bacterium]|nr:MATE family efflux transporter [Oscillospiraceae bacterium]
MGVKTNSIDMVNGPLWGKILKFSALYMLTAFLQHLYSAADVMVVGRFAGQAALAGVGTCSVLVNLFLNFILGLSAGATIVLGQAIGAKDKKDIGKTAHTSIAIAICGGLLGTVICLSFPEPLLRLIDVPENVMPEASIYLRIVSIGFIPSLVYNFGAAMLRAKGDTKRALYIVTVSGIINVVFNLFFVCVCKMTASGVALATVISQVFTAIAILYILCNETDALKLDLKRIRFHKAPLLKILRYGLPSGIQSSVYSISNVIVQSSINSFGSAAIAGSSAASSITNFYNVMVNSLYQAAIVFTSQNFGAKKFDRIKKIMFVCITYVIAVWGIQSVITAFFSEPLIRLYAPDDPAVLEMGLRKFNLLGYTYGLLGFMNVMSGALRGMGASVMNMITSIVGVCGIRILWIATAFQAIGTFESLFLCYPLSWLGTFFMHFTMFLFVFRKEKRKLTQQ